MNIENTLVTLSDGSLEQERLLTISCQKRVSKFTDDKVGYLTDKKTRNKSLARNYKQHKRMEGSHK